MPPAREHDRKPRAAMMQTARFLTALLLIGGLAVANWNLRGADVSSNDAAHLPAANRDFWSFRPLAHPAPPELADDSWSKTPVDRFILAKLREKGLSPNAAVDRRTLLRRATFDLTGLPPTIEEVQAFIADN